MNIGAEGQAVIRCVVATDDSLTACEVVSETPANSGFGAAALQLASLYLIAATQADGSPTAGGRVLIPIDFHLTADDGGPPVAPPPTP